MASGNANESDLIALLSDCYPVDITSPAAEVGERPLMVSRRCSTVRRHSSASAYRSARSSRWPKSRHKYNIFQDIELSPDL